MRTILHIGTHKTGTSSIQTMLTTNRDWLARQGVHYPLGPRSSRNVNFIPADIARSRSHQAASFLRAAVRQANAAGQDTLLLSAESFYAMTAFFRRLLDEPVADYWAEERRSIRTLSELLPEGPVQVVCYLRPPEKFLESIYNQFVKQAPGFSEPIEAFTQKAGPLSDYARHLDIWSDVFGDTAVTVRLYDHAVPDVAADFAREVLGLDAMPVMPRAPVNTRLDADVLAFKRILNRLGMPLAEAVVASRVVGRLASSADSAALSSQAHSSRPKVEHAPGRTDPPTSRFGEGNGNGELDAASFGTAPDAAVRSGGVDLTPERAMELMLRYRAEMRRPSIRAEVLLRRCARAGLDRAPWLERGLSGVRRLLNRRRVYLEREGRL